MEIILFHFVLFSFFTQSMCSQNSKYDECSNAFSCGTLDGLGYPFYCGSTRPNYCGYPGFQLDCSPGIRPKITINDQEYYLKHVDNYSITVSINNTWQHQCPDRLAYTTIDLSRFNVPSITQVVTFFYDCQGYVNTNLSTPTLNTTCDLGGFGSLGGYYLTKAMLKANGNLNLYQNCQFYIIIPVTQSEAEAINNKPEDMGTLIKAFQDGFDLDLIANNTACSSCVDSNGVCGYDFNSSKFVCHCEDHDYSLQCGVGSSIDQDSTTKSGKHKITLLIGVSTGVVAVLTILGACLLIIQKSKQNQQNKSVEDSLKNYASLVPKRSYKYIKKITKSFREKIGEGSYGTVFKGGLKDGRLVAVKVWKKSKGDCQDFLNEVMSVSRTSHVNVVPLLGFCFDGQKRALIYEFMPNGSLEKFIQGKYFSENNQVLSPQKIFEIGVGVARGLEYLHRGCNTRIVHFDIKPHNILLDVDFIPKISDFGLAKSYHQKESLISMSGARGTAGYIAPEVFFRTYGVVSHKSDVYSYGMMMLEMVGCKNNVNVNVESSSETYFPQWIYHQLELGTKTINDKMIINEKEKELERKMILVGLWCIQTNPMNRPSMTRVVEMLEGKVESLQVPPVPTLSSTPREQLTYDDSSSFL